MQTFYTIFGITRDNQRVELCKISELAFGDFNLVGLSEWALSRGYSSIAINKQTLISDVYDVNENK